MSRDPMGVWGDGTQRGNAQSYCANNPVNCVDPYGLDTIPPNFGLPPPPPGGLLGGFMDGASAGSDSLGDALDALAGLDPSKLTAEALAEALWNAIQEHAAALGAQAARRLLDALVPQKMLAELLFIFGYATYKALWADEGQCGEYVFGYEIGRGLVEWLLSKIGAKTLGPLLKTMAKGMAAGGGGPVLGGVLGGGVLIGGLPLPRGGTYRLRDKDTGEVRRTGKTNDLDRREREHGRHPDTKDLDFEVDRRSDNPDERTGREQIIHDQHPEARHPSHPEGGTEGGLNKRRAISPTNPDRDKLLEAGKKL